MSDKLKVLSTIANRYATEELSEKRLHFPVLDAVRPAINYYAKRPGYPISSGVDLARGGIRVEKDPLSNPRVSLFRDDGGLLSRPVSATGFGELREEDPLSDTISATITASGIIVTVGQQELALADDRPAEHLARVFLTFYTNK